MKIKIDKTIGTVIFDIGQVLLQYDWEGYLQSFGYDSETYEILADAIFRNADWEKGDEGAVTPAEWKQLFVENAPGYAVQIQQVYEGLGSVIRPFPYTEEWIRYFRRQGYKLYYLSNYSEYLYEQTKQHMGFLEEFDGGIFSYRAKCIKPDARIYRMLLDRYHICPQEALFFDDRSVNTAAASQLGIQSIVFTQETAYDMLQNV